MLGTASLQVHRARMHVPADQHVASHALAQVRLVSGKRGITIPTACPCRLLLECWSPVAARSTTVVAEHVVLTC
eukprot:5359923-Lingulodinium_polyedra.AAC.1